MLISAAIRHDDQVLGKKTVSDDEKQNSAAEGQEEEDPDAVLEALDKEDKKSPEKDKKSPDKSAKGKAAIGTALTAQTAKHSCRYQHLVGGNQDLFSAGFFFTCERETGPDSSETGLETFQVKQALISAHLP